MAPIAEFRAANEVAAVDDGSATWDERGEWTPRVQGVAPLLDWPWRPLRVLRYLFTALHAGTAVATLHDRTEELRQRMRRKRRMPTAAKSLG